MEGELVAMFMFKKLVDFQNLKGAAIYTSKFKWAWQAQFLSRTLQILEIN